MRLLSSALLAFILIGSVHAREHTPQKIRLTFGIYASDKPTVVVKKFRPILDELEKQLSEITSQPVSIKMHIARDYRGGVEDLVQKKVDISRLGPASYITARRLEPEIRPLVIESHRGEKTFPGVIITRKNADIKTIKDLKNRSFAFGNIDSTVGRYLSQKMLRENGIRARDLSNYQYHDRHDLVAFAVDEGQFDGGALKKDTFIRLQQNGLAIRHIATINNISKPWVARAGMDPKLFNTLRQALLELHQHSQLDKIRDNPFLPADDSDFAETRDAIENNFLFFK